MAEGARLKALCAIHTIPELSRTIGMGTDPLSAAEFQRRLATDLAHELAGFMKDLGEEGAELFSRMLERFRVENVKVLIRGFLNKIPAEDLRPHLIPVPETLALDLQKLLGAGSLESLAAMLPAGAPYQRLREAILIQHIPAAPFFLEAALDNGYFDALSRQIRELSGEDLASVKPLIQQDTYLFQFMLVIRGKFVYGLPSETLLTPSAAGVSRDWFKNLLAAPDLAAAAKLGVGEAIDEVPAHKSSENNRTYPAALEALCWNRYHRLANAAFRCGHMGLGAVFGYAALRRMETANLITLSEAIPLGMAGEEIHARLIPRTNLEASHV